MKKIIAFVLAAMTFVLPCFAETVYMDDNYEADSFVVGATVPQYGYFNGKTFINRYGAASYTYGQTDAGKTLDVSLAGKSDAGYYVFFTSTDANIVPYTKKGVVFETEFSITDGMRINISFKPVAGGSSKSIFYLDKNVFKVYNDGVAGPEETHWKTLEPDVFHTLKVIIYTAHNEFSIWLDGENIGGTNTIISGADWSSGLYYMYLSHGALNATVLPAVARYNRMSLKGYVEDGIEIAGNYSLYEDGAEKDSFTSDGQERSICFDMFNNGTEPQSFLALCMNYGKNENDYSFIKGMNAKKLELVPGYNRVVADGIIVPESNGTDFSNIYFIESLITPKLFGPVLKILNDGTDISVSKE